MPRLEIYPKERDSFFAISFTPDKYDDLEDQLDNWEDLSLVQDDDDKWYVYNDRTFKSAEIQSGYYFVVCGPFWDIMSPTELMDDFRIG